jgi:hypothetical protein
MSLDITIFPYTIRDKAFTKWVFDSEDCEKIKETFCKISRKRGISKSFIFGRDNVQALMAFYNNTPNNTLGLFWMESIKNNPVFCRRKDIIPEWMEMKSNKQKRNMENYVNSKGKEHISGRV